MKHLNPETLARLVDEPADRFESEHLATCEPCRTTLEEFRGQTAALGALPVVRPPRGGWEALEARLANEGLVAQDGNRFLGAWASWGTFRRAAAGVVLFAAGLGLGAQNPNAVSPGTDSLGSALPPVTQTAFQVGSLDDALAQLEVAEGSYVDALRGVERWGASGANVGTVPNLDPTTHLATLETLLATNRVALGQLPTDPLLNQIQLHLLERRDAVARQVTSMTEEWY